MSGRVTEDLGDRIRVRMDVQDTGVGIRLRHKGLLFRPYQQLRDGRAQGMGGTGLGLALVKQLIEKHGGCVYVHTALNVGSRFVIELTFKRVPEEDIPSGLDVEKAHDQSVTEATNHVHRSSPLTDSQYTGRALVVDDVRLIRASLCAMLRGYGIQCDVAADGPEAVQLMKSTSTSGSEAYRFVLMDNEMGLGMGGPQAIEAIRKFDTTTPIYGLTGHVMPADQKKFLDAGAVDVFGKPITDDQITRLLEGHCSAAPRDKSKAFKVRADGNGQRVLVVDDRCVNSDPADK